MVFIFLMYVFVVTDSIYLLEWYKVYAIYSVIIIIIIIIISFNLQFSPEELESDAKHVFSIILLDAEFEGLMGELTHHRATDAVYEALMTIQRAPEPVADAERIEFLELSAEVSQIEM